MSRMRLSFFFSVWEERNGTITNRNRVVADEQSEPVVGATVCHNPSVTLWRSNRCGRRYYVRDAYRWSVQNCDIFVGMQTSEPMGLI